MKRKMVVLSIIVVVVAVLGILVWASASINSGVYVRAYCRDTTATEKVAYLTFDDGPHPVYTPAVLNALKKKNAKATFFLIGKNIAGNEDLVRRIKEDGHVIGCHSFTHENTFPLYFRHKMMNDFIKCAQTIEDVTGERPKLFRPPFGVTNPNIASCAKRLNFKVVGWSIRTFDTVTDEDDVVLDRIKSQLEPGCIILLHDRFLRSGQLVDKVLSLLDLEGYRYDLPLPVDNIYK
ncbi:MAG: polysaccharide deacetylase family protein [Bacteroidales bacterium]|nr:polysaccharide deacetylase family protein [Bacteroidales bacterium]